MAPEPTLPRRVGRKLTKRRKPERYPSVLYPERLKEGDDVQDDVTAAKGQPAQYVNQSVFSLITAAGSKVDFNARFDEDSSDSDEEAADPNTIIRNNAAPVPSNEAAHVRPDTVMEGAGPSSQDDDKDTKHRAPRSLPKLSLRTIEEKNYMSQSSLPTTSGQRIPSEGHQGFTPRDAPVMSKMLEAQAQLGSSTNLSGTEKDDSERSTQDKNDLGRTTLVRRLMEIFGFESPEEVIAGW